MSKSMRIDAKYAVPTLLRALHKDNVDAYQDDRSWILQAHKALASRRLQDVDALERSMLDGVGSLARFSHTRASRTRLGRSVSTFDAKIMMPERMIAMTGMSGMPWGMESETILVQREQVELRAREIEMRNSATGYGIARHAIDRLYDRESLDHTQLRARLATDMSNLDRALAFAIASNTFMHGGPYDPGATTMVPLGDGLLIVRNVVLAAPHDVTPSRRTLITKNGQTRRPATIDAMRNLGTRTYEGHELDAYLYAIGITYLSADMLRFDQRSYLVQFEREAALHDLDAVADETWRTWLPHEKYERPPAIQVDDRLHRLLARGLGPYHPSPAYCVIGWKGTSDPRKEKA